jgi:hypothetical protein
MQLSLKREKYCTNVLKIHLLCAISLNNAVEMNLSNICLKNNDANDDQTTFNLAVDLSVINLFIS